MEVGNPDPGSCAGRIPSREGRPCRGVRVPAGTSLKVNIQGSRPSFHAWNDEYRVRSYTHLRAVFTFLA